MPANKRQEQFARLDAWLTELHFRHPLLFSLLPVFFVIAVLTLAMLLKTGLSK